MLILVPKENEQDQTYLFQNTYSKSCKIHHLAIMYCFVHTNQRIHLTFLFQSLYKLFLRACICISNIFHV